MCEQGKSIKAHLTSRVNFSNPLPKNLASVSIHVDNSVKSFFGDTHWLTSKALDHCPSACTITDSAANVIVSNLVLPGDRTPTKIYALLNLEPHSFTSLPLAETNVALMSYHAESELLVNYAYRVLQGFGLCIGIPDGEKQGGRKCENMLRRDSPFFRWCSASFGGDLYSCVFNVVPHVVRGINQSSEALAATWVSQTCERHNGYLAELMKHMRVDSMGRCHRNRDELAHPALLLARDADGIWWGKDSPVPLDDTGAKKMLIASSYKFFLSMENTAIDDYLTEKFFEGFLADTLLVYLGAPNARRAAPAPHSFVSALDFEGPAALAAFLVALAVDEPRRQSYLAWRRPAVRVSEGFAEAMRHDLVRLDNRSMLCRLCRLAHGHVEIT